MASRAFNGSYDGEILCSVGDIPEITFGTAVVRVPNRLGDFGSMEFDDAPCLKSPDLRPERHLFETLVNTKCN